MSEIINNSRKRKELLKHMILQLHSGEAPEIVRSRLIALLKSIPYNEVVEVEQELISEGLPAEEVLKFCDIHQMVLDGHIDQTGARDVPPGHPVHTFRMENRELEKVIDTLEQMFEEKSLPDENSVTPWLLKVNGLLNQLMDVDKHYKRKEYLLFPFLEKHEITGPPKVMWGKHDEIREQLKAAIEAVKVREGVSRDEIKSVISLLLMPAVKGVSDMISKEEEILFPMCLDKLTEEEWYSVYSQTMEFGYCLYDPPIPWKPESLPETTAPVTGQNGMTLSTGSFSAEELEAIFRTLPVDITFVDKNDKVKFFSLGPDRIFTRNRAILGRDVRMCHPPDSVHIVEQILNDFRSGKENSAAFWINMQGKFIYIEYYAVRDEKGNYLGTLEFTQDLTVLRKLEGEQRLLSYEKPR